MSISQKAKDALTIGMADKELATEITDAIDAAASIDASEIADGSITNAKVSASAAIAFSKLAALTSAQILVGNGSNVPTAVAVSGDATMANTGAVTIATGAVTLAKIATAAKPIFHVVGAGTFTTLGGDASETITVSGAVGTDTALVWVQKAGATPRTVDSYSAGTGNIAVTLSGDPSTDHKLGYIVIRAAA